MSGTRPPVRYIRRGEEGVRASDLGPSENQATGTVQDKDLCEERCNKEKYWKFVISCKSCAT